MVDDAQHRSWFYTKPGSDPSTVIYKTSCAGALCAILEGKYAGEFLKISKDSGHTWEYKEIFPSPADVWSNGVTCFGSDREQPHCVTYGYVNKTPSKQAWLPLEILKKENKLSSNNLRFNSLSKKHLMASEFK